METKTFKHKNGNEFFVLFNEDNSVCVYQTVAALDAVKGVTVIDDKITVEEPTCPLPLLASNVQGFIGNYLITNDGHVLSLQRNKILSPSINNRGYEQVTLRSVKTGQQESVFIHRLVAEAFIPNPENKPQVNHIDGVKRNNVVENLQWATISENIQHAFDTGLLKKQTGENSHLSSLTSHQVLQIRQLLDQGFSSRHIASRFDISHPCVLDIKHKRTYTDVI